MLLTLHEMTVIFQSEVSKLVYMSHTTTRDAERTTDTPSPLIVCARLSPLRKVLFCSLSAPPILPLVHYTKAPTTRDNFVGNSCDCFVGQQT